MLFRSLWLLLCRINKLGYIYPRRLLRSPTLVGHQDYFPAPLSGSIALYISSLGKYTLAFLLSLSFLLSMVNFFETRSYWQGRFTEDQQKYCKECRLSEKGKHLWEQISRLNNYARNLCSIYDISYCFDKSCCFVDVNHLSFQCACNDDKTLASYVKGNYDFYRSEERRVGKEC